MRIKSRFSWRVFIASFCLSLSLGLLFMIARMLMAGKEMITAVFVFLIVFLIAALFMFLELRKRAVKITIAEYGITVRSFFGLGASRSYSWEEISDFTTTNLSSTYNDYEYLFIYRDGKTVIAVSTFYHKNYEELKAAIAEKITYRGAEGVDLFREIKRLF